MGDESASRLVNKSSIELADIGLGTEDFVEATTGSARSCSALEKADTSEVFGLG